MTRTRSWILALLVLALLAVELAEPVDYEDPAIASSTPALLVAAPPAGLATIADPRPLPLVAPLHHPSRAPPAA